MRRRTSAVIVLLHALAAGCAKDAPLALPADYREQVDAFREKRAREIIAPTGWAALVGLHFLTLGTLVVGSAPGSDVRLTGPSAPPTLGTMTVTAGTARLGVAKGVEVRRGSDVLTDI